MLFAHGILIRMHDVLHSLLVKNHPPASPKKTQTLYNQRIRNKSAVENSPFKHLPWLILGTIRAYSRSLVVQPCLKFALIRGLIT